MEKDKQKDAAETEAKFLSTVADLIEVHSGELDTIAEEVYRKFSWAGVAIGVCLPDIAQFKGDGAATGLLRHYLASKYIDGEVHTHTDAVRCLAEGAQIILLLQAQNLVFSQVGKLSKLFGVEGGLMDRTSFDLLERLSKSNLNFMKMVNDFQDSSATSRRSRMELGAGGGTGLEDILLKAESAAADRMGQSTVMFLLEKKSYGVKSDGVTADIFDVTGQELTEAEEQELRN